MHRCWLVPELTVLIAEHCTGPSEFDSDVLRSLCSLARTCRTLQEPALDLLWYQADTLAHLIKLLPQELWTWEKTNALVSGFLCCAHE